MANDRKMYSILKDCERCRVYGTDNTPLADARVQSVGTEVWLYFRTSRLRDARVRTQVDFYDRQSGLLSCLCELLIRRNPAFPQIPEIWMADCRILRVIKMVQRQKDVRVKTHVESEFHTEAGRLFFGTVQNLSAGGLYLRTFQSLKTKQRLTFLCGHKGGSAFKGALWIWMPVCKSSARGRGGYSSLCVYRAAEKEREMQ